VTDLDFLSCHLVGDQHVYLVVEAFFARNPGFTQLLVLDDELAAICVSVHGVAIDSALRE